MGIFYWVLYTHLPSDTISRVNPCLIDGYNSIEIYLFSAHPLTCLRNGMPSRRRRVSGSGSSRCSCSSRGGGRGRDNPGDAAKQDKDRPKHPERPEDQTETEMKRPHLFHRRRRPFDVRHSLDLRSRSRVLEGGAASSSSQC